MWVLFDGKVELRWINAFISVDADRDDVRLPPYADRDDVILPPYVS